MAVAGFNRRLVMFDTVSRQAIRNPYFQPQEYEVISRASV